MPGGPGKINEYDKSLTACERKAKARKGGLASGKSRREKAYIRRIAAVNGDMKAVDKWERYVGQADSGAGSGKVMIIDDV